MDSRDLWQWKVARFSEILETLDFEVEATFDFTSVNRFWPSSGAEGEYLVYHVTLYHPAEGSEFADFLYQKPQKIRRRKKRNFDAEFEVFKNFFNYCGRFVQIS